MKNTRKLCALICLLIGASSAAIADDAERVAALDANDCAPAGDLRGEAKQALFPLP